MSSRGNIFISRRQDLAIPNDKNSKVYLDFNDSLKFTTLSYNHSRVCEIFYELVHYRYPDIQSNARRYIRIVHTKQHPWNKVNCKFQSRGQLKNPFIVMRTDLILINFYVKRSEYCHQTILTRKKERLACF